MEGQDELLTEHPFPASSRLSFKVEAAEQEYSFYIMPWRQNSGNHYVRKQTAAF
jgi:hypothetical protein